MRGIDGLALYLGILSGDQVETCCFSVLFFLGRYTCMIWRFEWPTVDTLCGEMSFHV